MGAQAPNVSGQLLQVDCRGGEATGWCPSQEPAPAPGQHLSAAKNCRLVLSDVLDSHNSQGKNSRSCETTDYWSGL